MIISGFPEECLSSQWFDVEQPNPRLDIVFHRNSFDFIHRIVFI